MSLHIGIVGCGRILNAHLRGLKLLKDRRLADFTISALCSRNIQDALMFRSPADGVPSREPVTDAPHDGLSAPHHYISDLQQEEPHVYDDFRQLAADDDLDAVIVLTALDSHHEIGLAFLDTGKHVLMEKPLAVTVAAGRRLVEAADRAGAVLATAEVARFLPECRARHWAVDSGQIGDFRMLVSGMLGHPDWSPDRIVGDTPWRHQILRAGGGPSIDLGVHRLNQIEYECGPIASISAMAATTEPTRRYRAAAPSEGQIEANAEDTVFAALRFASGAIGTLLLSWGGRGRLADVPGFAIFGSEGSIHGDQLTGADGRGSDIVAEMRAAASPTNLQSWFPDGITDAFALEALDWLAAIDARNSGRRPEVDGHAGLRDLAAAFTILESDVARREVSVQEVLTGKIDLYQQPINDALGL